MAKTAGRAKESGENYICNYGIARELTPYYVLQAVLHCFAVSLSFSCACFCFCCCSSSSSFLSYMLGKTEKGTDRNRRYLKLPLWFY